eukprot:g1643.t1
MFAKLSALVSGSNTLPFDFIDVQGKPTSGPWTHHSGTLKSDKTPVSIFKFSFSPGHDSRITNGARHGIKSLRTLRHPGVLVFKDSIEVEEKGSTTLYLITEPIRLLSSLLAENELSHDYVSMGVRQIACALSFLNNDCHQVHGNINLRTIVVSQNLDWKLAFLDTLSEHSSLTTSVLRDSVSLIRDVYKSPELTRGDWQSLVDGPPWAVDSWGLGCLIREVYNNGELLPSTGALREVSSLPPELLKDYQRLLNSHCEKRLNPKRLLNNKYLNNELVEVVKFLESLAVKEVGEKNAFFNKLIRILPSLPVLVLHQKILSMVIAALEFGSASPTALSCVLKISEDMNEEKFSNSVVPALTRLFGSSDRTTRRVLLENIENFGDRLPSALIDSKIYPAISNGFADSNAYLRELTLKSMQHLAPKLSQKTLNQSLLKFLARLQVDPEPSIRANTTVLLGFIAEHLGEASCKRILLNAFSRALKDQFPPARLAALRSFVATRKFYSTEEIATRVVPAISPLCIDGVTEVKTVGLSCLTTFVDVLKTEATHVAEEQDSTDQQQSKNQSQNYVSWVVSSLGFASGSPEVETKKPDPVPEKTPVSNPSPVPDPVQQETGDDWDFEEDNDDNDLFESAPSTPTEKTKRGDIREETTKKDTHEDDVWSDLGMKATMPKKKPKGKGMKLGATKLSVD